jgi:hypothetical protein
MSSRRIFDCLARRFLLTSLEERDREKCLSDANLRELTRFRFFYLMTFQGPVLTPLLILLANDGGLGLALMSLGIARLAMVVFEIPMGVVADVFGAKRAAQAGLGLMAAVMLGFVALAACCALGGQTAAEYRVGVIGTFVLQILFGCAFALINGADDSLTEAVFRVSRLSHLNARQIQALGKTIRYSGAMVAVGVGAAWFQVANVIPITPAARLLVQSGVFLATFLAIVAALVALGRIRPLGPVSQANGPPIDDSPSRSRYVKLLKAHWRDLKRAVAFAVADRGLSFSLWWLSALLAVAWFAAYSLQSPLTDLMAALTRESPLWMSLFVVQALIGQWASSRGGKYLFEASKDGNSAPPTAAQTEGTSAAELKRPVTRKEAARRERREVARVLFVTLAALVLMVACKAGLALLLFTAITLASVLCYFVRGVAEPATSAIMGSHADRYDTDVRNALRSMNSAFVGCCFFVEVLLFGLVGSALHQYSPEVNLGTPEGKTFQTALTCSAFIVAMTTGSLVLSLFHRVRVEGGLPAPERVVVIGSYREDFAGLLALCKRLGECGLHVLHPRPSSAVVGEEDGFVRLNTDPSPSIEATQRRVFHLIDTADFVILYSPEGRVGTSAAMEVGYALKTNRPVKTLTRLQDVTLRALVGDPDPALLTRLERCHAPATARDS